MICFGVPIPKSSKSISAIFDILINGSAARRETSTQAKELFKDADVAKNFFSKFKKETDELEWYQRTPEPQCCKKNSDCGSAEAMFWCHPCGLAFCLECRVNGQACEHNIINYSSELSSGLMPDSIGSRDSHFDIGVLIDAVLAESPYFGATRSEHAQNRQEGFQKIVFSEMVGGLEHELYFSIYGE